MCRIFGCSRMMLGTDRNLRLELVAGFGGAAGNRIEGTRKSVAAAATGAPAKEFASAFCRVQPLGDGTNQSSYDGRILRLRGALQRNFA